MRERLKYSKIWVGSCRCSPVHSFICRFFPSPFGFPSSSCQPHLGSSHYLHKKKVKSQKERSKS